MNTYITTPIYYASGSPHLGHAYTTLLADGYSRYLRLKGDGVLLLTGTDEHGQKIERTAEKYGSEVNAFVDRISQEFRQLWLDLDIQIDIFKRTTEASHVAVALEFWQRLHANGDLYRGEYSGLYCVECEQYFTSGNVCPTHKVALEQYTESCWFFRLSQYRQLLVKHIETHPSFIQPVQRKNEVLSFLRLNPLRDLAVSRGSTNWGIPVPGDESQVLYVWIDALVTYLSGLSGLDSVRSKNSGLKNNGTGDAGLTDQSEPQQLPGPEDWWSGAHHFIGKDILLFHGVYWPALLISAGYELPRSIIVNGWLTVESEKISKSRPATVIDPRELTATIGIDGLRYYLYSQVGLGQDLDFNQAQAIQTINADLANNIGNLVGRVVGLAVKYHKGVIHAPVTSTAIPDPWRGVEPALVDNLQTAITSFEQHLDNFEFARASKVITGCSSELNAWLQKHQPWKVEDTAVREHLLWQACVSIRCLSILLSPLVPLTALKIRRALGLDDTARWAEFSTQVTHFTLALSEPIFVRIDSRVN